MIFISGLFLDENKVEIVTNVWMCVFNPIGLTARIDLFYLLILEMIAKNIRLPIRLALFWKLNLEKLNW